ncbi:eukaryotic translation initiation factor 2-alpha kinase 3-like isoform X2 [Mastacembelus armatus]|uniref:eukaryotic translation initiation factor 2-alpha kinase 3-like isoform X2 n=1 Tax=Mastacembelus armatus TaxID=205130 RepID=UPI000E460C36|nr:eukaryotic translation initiation factor 2-alpha kinase 3-like isoform X2 [Mastacembelus armatus]
MEKTNKHDHRVASVLKHKGAERSVLRPINGPAKKGPAAKNILSDVSEKENHRPVKTAENPTPSITAPNNGSCQRNRVPEPLTLESIVISGEKHQAKTGKTEEEDKEVAAKSGYHKRSSWSAVSDDALAKPSTTPCTHVPCDGKTKISGTATSNPVVSSSDSLKDQEQNPDVKPKIITAAHERNACQNTKEDDITSEETKPGKSASEMTLTQSETFRNRFTSEFDVIMCIGQGAFGCVFKVTRKLEGKQFAVKIASYNEIALREVKALSDLSHLHIVRYFTCWVEDSAYQWEDADGSWSTSQSSGNSASKYLYIQMELCDTKTLRVWIDEKNTQNVKKSLRKRREESLIIAQQIVSGVEYIHSKMFIHRDLKPGNIMFGREGEVKIGDFGLVTAENDDDAENLMERTVYKGTPSYMAPEQTEKTYDRKVDIFSLGLIYFELLWKINTVHEKQMIWADVRRRKLPDGFLCCFRHEYIIIRSLLSEKPEDRPEASKLKTDLDDCARSLNTEEIARRGSRTC